jgi:hypothetical protein
MRLARSSVAGRVPLRLAGKAADAVAGSTGYPTSGSNAKRASGLLCDKRTNRERAERKKARITPGDLALCGSGSDAQALLLSLRQECRKAHHALRRCDRLALVGHNRDA